MQVGSVAPARPTSHLRLRRPARISPRDSVISRGALRALRLPAVRARLEPRDDDIGAAERLCLCLLAASGKGLNRSGLGHRAAHTHSHRFARTSAWVTHCGPAPVSGCHAHGHHSHSADSASRPSVQRQPRRTMRVRRLETVSRSCAQQQTARACQGEPLEATYWLRSPWAVGGSRGLNQRKALQRRPLDPCSRLIRCRK